MSDAFHLLSDVASFIVALAAIYLAEKPPTKSMQMFHACTIRLLFFFFSNRTHIWISSSRSNRCTSVSLDYLGIDRIFSHGSNRKT